MPILVHLDRLLYQREVTLTELSGRVGLTVANLSILKTGKARAIRFTTLEAICRELDCQPGDLLEHLPEPDTEPASRPGQSGAGHEETRSAKLRQGGPSGGLGAV